MFLRIKKLVKLLKYQKQVRAALSTQLSILENDDLFALGGLTDKEEQEVVRLLQIAGDGIVIELGTLFGLTTARMAQYKRPNQQIVTVDNFCWNPFGLTPRMHRDWTSRILRSWVEEGRIKLIEADSVAFRESYTGEIPCMVFLDADHSYEAVRDEIAWAKKMKIPLICGHDYGNPSFGVTRAVDEAFPMGVHTCGMIWSWCP